MEFYQLGQYQYGTSHFEIGQAVMGVAEGSGQYNHHSNNYVTNNIALVRTLRIWVAQRMYWYILPKQGWSYILVKMSIFWKFFFAFSNVKSLSEYVVKNSQSAHESDVSHF